jgi:hypothetical protein
MLTVNHQKPQTSDEQELKVVELSSMIRGSYENLSPLLHTKNETNSDNQLKQDSSNEIGDQRPTRDRSWSTDTSSSSDLESLASFEDSDHSLKLAEHDWHIILESI